jgi:hypothetical protein
LAVSVPRSLVTAANIAEVTSSLDYFNFAAGVSPVPFSFLFTYTFDFDDSGTIGSGSALWLTTATADITNSAGITVASGATVRLGKKATYTIDFFFQNGSTVEVFPNADRSGADLDLTNCTFAATTTINVTSGTATVLVLSTTGITAGAGVTLSAPSITLTLVNLIPGSRIYIQNTTDNINLFNTVEATTTFSGTVPVSKNLLIRVRNASGSTKYKPFQSTLLGITSSTTLTINQELDE